jgi:membrane protease YdiL (CAAX protease family)
MTTQRAATVRLFAVAIAWLLVVRYASAYGVLLLPEAITNRLTLQGYLLIVQIVTTALGVGMALAILPRARDALALRRLTAFQTLASLLSSPGVFVAASAVAIGIALPTLAAELRQGVEATQRNAGEFGRALRQAPAFVTVLWGVLLGPVTEELLFRGILWSAITSYSSRFVSSPRKEPLDSFVRPSAVARGARAFGKVLLTGGVATLLSAALFGAMHDDMKGGVGIVRVVSTTCLGLACGTARHATGSVVAAMALHLSYNLFSLGQTRHWWNVLGFGAVYGVSTFVATVGVLAASALGVAYVARCAKQRAPRPADG